MRKLFFILMAVLASTLGVMAQNRTYHGTVVDAANDEPLIGATVTPIGGGQGVATDIDGKFVLTVPANVKQIKVSYVGYTPGTATLKDNMIIPLSSTSANLDDLVVVAYGQQKKSSITGSVAQVNSEQISERPTSSVISALEGTTSGINVTGNYGEAGSSPSITIRGIGTVNGTTSPLYVIDGVPFGGNMTDLNNDDIESISVLKDAASAALYGNRASNGVILITTKKAKEKDKIHVNFKTRQGWYERAIPEYAHASIPEWMDAQFLNYRNGAVISKDANFDWSDADAIKAANVTANDSFISQWIYLNIFDKANNQLFNDAGVFDRSAAIKGTYAQDLDWFDQATRKGYRGEYTLNVMGATAKSDYRFSLSYLKEDGYMKDNTYDRITGSANINVTPRKWIKTGFKVNVSHQKTEGTMNGVGDGNTSFNNAFYVCRYISPIYPVHLHDVNTGEYLLSDGEKRYDPGFYNVKTTDGNEQQINTRNQFSNRNVVWEQAVNARQTIRNTMNGTAYVDIILPYGITAKIQGNLNTRNSDNWSYGSALIGDAYQEGSLSKTIYTYKNYTFQQQLNWHYVFNDKNTFNVLAAHENYAYHYDYTYNSKRGQAFEGVHALSNFSEMKSISGYRSGYRLESYLARVQYNYDERYNIEASFRRDGSSRFAKDVRWGNFGSVGANWVFSNESFLKNAKWLNLGKLYVNWGQVGNDDAAGYYAYHALMGATTQDQLPGYIVTQLPATDLKWETSESFGLGIEGTLFDRWNISVEYYNKTNKDLIFAVNLPSSAGATGWPSDYNHPTIDKNIGTIRNCGVEISTDVDIVRTKDWKFNIGTTLSSNSNKIIKLPDENKYSLGYDQNGKELVENGYISGSYKIAEGHSRYQFYTYHWAGVDQMTGRSLYTANLDNYYIKKADGTIIGGRYDKDDAGNLVMQSGIKELEAANYVEINGKYYVNNYTYAAKQWSATTLPKVNGSFSGNLTYKNFNLSVLFTYSLGGKIYDSNYASLASTYGSQPAGLSSDILNSWKGIPAGMTEDSPNRITRDILPVLDYTDSYSNATSDRWLISRNYLCFKNISFTYALPKSVLRPIGVNDIKLTFQAENLFINAKRKGLNPQLGNNGAQGNYLVPARVFTFGLNFDL